MRFVGPRLQKTQHFKRNFALAFPEKTEAEIESLTREAWANLGAVLAEYPHLDAVCGRESTERIEIVVKGDIEVFRQPDKRAIFVAAHLANWEVLAAAAAVQQGIPLAVVYTSLQNPWLDRMLWRRRQALGCHLIPREDGMRAIMRQLAQGRSIGLLIDQRMDSGEPVPFFGLEKPTTVIPARLALRFGCELIPTRVQRLSGARFRVTFHEPVKPDDESAEEREKVLQMMGKVNALFESWIRERPHEWLCSNRRWPKGATPLSSN